MCVTLGRAGFDWATVWWWHRLSPVPQSSPEALKVPCASEGNKEMGSGGDSCWDSSSQGVTTELYEGSHHSAPPFCQEPTDLLRAAQGACEMDGMNGWVDSSKRPCKLCPLSPVSGNHRVLSVWTKASLLILPYLVILLPLLTPDPPHAALPFCLTGSSCLLQVPRPHYHHHFLLSIICTGWLTPNF